MNQSYSSKIHSKLGKNSSSKKSKLPQLTNRQNLHFPLNKNLMSPSKSSQEKIPMRKTYHSSKKLQRSKRNQDQNPQKSMRGSQMFFTERLSKRFQEQLNELREQQQIRQQKSLQKKLQFKQKKHLKQHFLLKQKLDMLKEIQFRRNQRERIKQIEQTRKIQEKQFIHGCNIAKFSMMRSLHSHIRNQQIDLANQKLRQTQHLLNFKQDQMRKNKQNHQKLLESRLVFLMNNKIGNNPQEFLQKRMTCRLFVGRNSDLNDKSKDISSGRI